MVLGKNSRSSMSWAWVLAVFVSMILLFHAIKILSSRRIEDMGVVGKKVFSVAKFGFWDGEEAKAHHIFDDKLAAALAEFFKAENAATVLDFGAGMGEYAKHLKSEGLFVTCYDGNPSTQEISEGRCGTVDLSKPVHFSVHDWVMSLEVGEHIPAQFEETFIKNLVENNKFGVVLSWAVPKQGGLSHVNEKTNEYIRAKFDTLGFSSVPEAENKLRAAAKLGWFRSTLMVFRRKK